MTWEYARLKGLDSETISFLWRMLHDVLPTRSRLYHMRMPRIENENCQKCDVPDTIQHSLTACQDSIFVFQWLQRGINRLSNQNLSAEDILFLNFPPTNTLAMVWFTATVFQQIWKIKAKGKRPLLVEIRAEVEARINLLRKTKIGYVADTVKIMV